MVGWSEFGRITAEATCKAKAFELAVEKVAEPEASVAAGLGPSRKKVAVLAPERRKRAAPVRTWTLPDCSVLSRSPLKTVAPTDACPAPTWARSAKVTIPSEDEGAAQTGEDSSEIEMSRTKTLFIR